MLHSTYTPNRGGFAFADSSTPSRGHTPLRDILDEIDDQFHLWRAITDEDSAIQPDEKGVYSTAIDLPGYKREEIAIEADAQDGLIAVTAQNAKRGKTTHSFQLDGLDSEKVTAKLEDGILTLSAERVAGVKPRKVVVS